MGSIHSEYPLLLLLVLQVTSLEIGLFLLFGNEKDGDFFQSTVCVHGIPRWAPSSLCQGTLPSPCRIFPTSSPLLLGVAGVGEV